MLAHPYPGITRKTAEAMGIATTDQWGSCEVCLKTKAKRHAVPKMTDERASVGGPMTHSSLGGKNYVVFFVDDYTRFKVLKFVKKKE